ncbi:hypothetical protein [Streptomyces sp. NA02950]|uniref:hypothetical protein n=1 Tax=Streptomyces sp. NA02950 TaxID=2742137 RepID=UPI0020CB41C3|nr:hypothetical protein [Streptomyces sp. NA02950]
MTDRSLAALGFAEVPARQPLSYPGRPVTSPTLLTGGELWPLETAEGRLGSWPVTGPDGRRVPLDSVLTRLGVPTAGARAPVIAVGSNASPAQLDHKLSRPGAPYAVPMVPVEVTGIAVGCSAHIGRYGYVASAPYTDPEARTPLVVSWLDTARLAAVDATEYPNYRRVLLPGAKFPMVLPSGERLGGAYLYIGVRGVLRNPDATAPLPGGGDQSALLARLLAASTRLRTLLGPDPRSWVGRAGADPAVREAGTRAFRDEGWALPLDGLRHYAQDEGGGGSDGSGPPPARDYDALSFLP